MFAENGQVGYVLDQKLDWKAASGEQSRILNNMTLVTIITMAGVGLGSVVGGSIGPYFGVRNAILLSNLIGVAATGVKLVLTLPTILVGRFVSGFVYGIAVFCAGKSLNDTIPPEHMNLYGSFVNASFCAGIFLSNLLGMVVPLDDGRVSSEEAVKLMKADETWRLVYGAPLIFQLFTLVAIGFYFKEVSIIDLLEKVDEPHLEKDERAKVQ